MRDGRLIRSRHKLPEKKYNGKHFNGIGLIPLGDRNRYKYFEDAIEERNSDKTQMYLR